MNLNQIKKQLKKFVIDYVNALHPAQQMFLINYKSPQVKGSSCSMSYDTSVVCANTCPTTIISESSKEEKEEREEMDCTI